MLLVLTSGEAMHSRWVHPGQGPISWSLIPKGSEQALQREPEHDRARELERSFELLEAQYQAALQGGDEGRLLQATQNLAWVDPALALERVESGIFETAWMRDFSLSSIAECLLQGSPEESIAVAKRMAPGLSQALRIFAAAEHLEPGQELEQLALARAQARGIDPPMYRLVALAQLADRLLDLGQEKVAEEILAEGKSLAKNLPKEDWAGFARSRFGEVLARIDPSAGREMIDSLKDTSDIPRHLGNMAHKLAASHPAEAEALLAVVNGSHRSAWSAQRYVSRVVHTMALADPERAARLAQQYDPTGYSHGMLAKALVEHQPAEAQRYLELAFTRAEAFEPKSAAWDQSAQIAAAALLPLAAEIDPRGLRSFLARVLALPGFQDRGAFRADSRRLKADAALAFYIARWDRELAKGLLVPIERMVRSTPSQADDLESLWAACAVVDPDWAFELGQHHGSKAAASIGLVLARPPEGRRRFVQDEYLHLWIIGKEDL